MSEPKINKYLSRDGFSLVELIITIAIMAVMVGGAALSIGLLRSADTQGLASGINSSLTDLKAYSESQRGPIYLCIYKVDGDGYYAHFGFPDPTGVSTDKPQDFDGTKKDGDHKLGSDSMTVKVVYPAGTYPPDDEIELTDGGDFAAIQIQKKDGAYVDVMQESPDPYDPTKTVETVFQPVPECFEIYKSGETTPDYKVVLAKETGLHYSEQQ